MTILIAQRLMPIGFITSGLRKQHSLAKRMCIALFLASHPSLPGRTHSAFQYWTTEVIALLRHMLSRFLCPAVCPVLQHAVPVVASSNVNSDLTELEIAFRRFTLDTTQRADHISSAKIRFLGHCVKKACKRWSSRSTDTKGKGLRRLTWP